MPGSIRGLVCNLRHLRAKMCVYIFLSTREKHEVVFQKRKKIQVKQRCLAPPTSKLNRSICRGQGSWSVEAARGNAIVSLPCPRAVSPPQARVTSNTVLALMLPIPRMSILALASPSRSCSCSYKCLPRPPQFPFGIIGPRQSCLFRNPVPTHNLVNIEQDHSISS
jgi:hypothetical protein